MNVSLTPELAKFVEKEVESGLYQTASEVVRAGLRRLKEDQSARLPQTPKDPCRIGNPVARKYRSVGPR